jgi:hypothetical protein
VTRWIGSTSRCRRRAAGSISDHLLWLMPPLAGDHSALQRTTMPRSDTDSRISLQDFLVRRHLPARSRRCLPPRGSGSGGGHQATHQPRSLATASDCHRRQHHRRPRRQAEREAYRRRCHATVEIMSRRRSMAAIMIFWVGSLASACRLTVRHELARRTGLPTMSSREERP